MVYIVRRFLPLTRLSLGTHNIYEIRPSNSHSRMALPLCHRLCRHWQNIVVVVNVWLTCRLARSSPPSYTLKGMRMQSKHSHTACRQQRQHCNSTTSRDRVLPRSIASPHIILSLVNTYLIYVCEWGRRMLNAGWYGYFFVYARLTWAY